MKRFLYDGATCSPTGPPPNIIERQVARIRAQVGDAHVLCALCGGVDSVARRCWCTGPWATSSRACSWTTV